jgi:hypothetical protein
MTQAKTLVLQLRQARRRATSQLYRQPDTKAALPATAHPGDDKTGISFLLNAPFIRAQGVISNKVDY